MAIETRPPPRQPLVMAPLLRQAIQLLQLSPLELQEMGRNERLGNPLLDAAVPQTIATSLETTPPMPVQPAAAGIASASSG
jgi:DNA-directed RNA polymerase specialized sigma54-like protein